MKIEKIEKGQKYFYTICTQLTNKTTGKKFREVSTVRVLDIDQAKKKVCASYNGFPAQWYEQKQFARWKTTDPRLEEKIK